MPSLGPAEILVVLVIALLVFGPNKMPDIARQMGKGYREFRRVQQHLKSELRDVVSEFDSPSSTPSVQPEPVPMLPPKDDAPAPPNSDGTPGPEATFSAPSATPTTSAPSTPEAVTPPALPPTAEPDAPSEPA